MSDAPGPPEPSPGWAARHKKLLASAGVILFLILALVVGGLYYVRSGRLNRYIITQVQTAHGDFGMHAEIASLDISWPVRTVNARDIKLYNQETGQLIATLDAAEIVVEVPDPFALSLRRDVYFKEANLDNLQA